MGRMMIGVVVAGLSLLFIFRGWIPSSIWFAQTFAIGTRLAFLFVALAFWAAMAFVMKVAYDQF